MESATGPVDQFNDHIGRLCETVQIYYGGLYVKLLPILVIFHQRRHTVYLHLCSILNHFVQKSIPFTLP